MASLQDPGPQVSNDIESEGNQVFKKNPVDRIFTKPIFGILSEIHISVRVKAEVFVKVLSELDRKLDIEIRIEDFMFNFTSPLGPICFKNMLLIKQISAVLFYGKNNPLENKGSRLRLKTSIFTNSKNSKS